MSDTAFGSGEEDEEAPVQVCRLEAVVTKGGRIVLENVPFAEGAPVEIVVRERAFRVAEGHESYSAGDVPCRCGEPAAEGVLAGREEATMQEYRIETTVQKGGKVMLERLPFREGERVEVTVAERPEPATADEAHPYWGKPFRYDRPTDPVAEDDWEVLR